MSVCSTTGLSQTQQERWPYLYKHLIEDIDVPDLSSITEAYISSLDGDLKKVI